MEKVYNVASIIVIVILQVKLLALLGVLISLFIGLSVGKNVVHVVCSVGIMKNAKMNQLSVKAIFCKQLSLLSNCRVAFAKDTL